MADMTGLMAALTGAGSGYQQGQTQARQLQIGQAQAQMAYGLKAATLAARQAYEQARIQGYQDNTQARIDAAKAADQSRQADLAFHQDMAKLGAQPKPLTPLDYANMRNSAIATAGNLPQAEQGPYVTGQNALLPADEALPVPGVTQTGSRARNYGFTDPSQVANVNNLRTIAEATGDPNATVQMNGQPMTLAQFNAKYPASPVPVLAPYYTPTAPVAATIANTTANAANTKVNTALAPLKLNETVRNDKANNAISSGRNQITAQNNAANNANNAARTGILATDAATNQGRLGLDAYKYQNPIAPPLSPMDIDKIRQRITYLETPTYHNVTDPRTYVTTRVAGPRPKDIGGMPELLALKQRLAAAQNPANPAGAGYALVPGIGRAAVTPAGLGPLPGFAPAPPIPGGRAKAPSKGKLDLSKFMP